MLSDTTAQNGGSYRVTKVILLKRAQVVQRAMAKNSLLLTTLAQVKQKANH